MSKLIKRIKRFKPGGKTYPSDLPVYAYDMWDSYKHPNIVYVSDGQTYVKNYDPGEQRAGDDPIIGYNTTGIMPEIEVRPYRISPNTVYGRVDMLYDNGPGSVLSPYDPSDVIKFIHGKSIINNGGDGRTISIPEDEPTYMLYDHGKASNSKYTYSLLNAVAEDYSRAGVPLIYMLGHPYQETTWGNELQSNNNKNSAASAHPYKRYGYIKNAYTYNPIELFQGWDTSLMSTMNRDFDNRLFQDYNTGRYYISGRDVNDTKALGDYLQKAHEKGDIYETPLYRIAKYFGTGKYNSGDPHYYSSVEDRGRDMLSQKDVQEWVKTQPYYNPNTIEEDFQKYKREHNLYNK